LTQHRESSNIGPRTSLYQRIASFIEKRLDDPELSPVMFARTHHISTRYLYLIFNERGRTVGGWIRARRLAQCRAELANSSRDRTVTEIAMHWGFSDLAHFSRSFRSAYGVSPLNNSPFVSLVRTLKAIDVIPRL
jgi:AraC-like DNA-binding protein